jgi:hypothetical protein
MSNTLSVRLSSRKTPEGEYFEGTANICGVRPTKLVRRADNTTQFPTRSAVMGAARNLAKTYGYTDVSFIDPAAAASTSKKAAKKSSTASRAKTASSPATASKPTVAATVSTTQSGAQRTTTTTR